MTLEELKLTNDKHYTIVANEKIKDHDNIIIVDVDDYRETIEIIKAAQ